MKPGTLQGEKHAERHRDRQGRHDRVQRQELGQGESRVRREGRLRREGTGRRIQGIGQIIEAWQGWGKAIPDSKATFVAEHASGDTAVLEVVWKGVHTGPLQTPTGIIPPSNKRIELPACQVLKVEDGKVKSFTHYFDMVTLLTQIDAFTG